MSAIEIAVQGPAGAARVHHFAALRPLWIGRDPSCDVVLRCELVSRRHARLSLQDGRLHVEDCSANGTRVGGERLHGSACAGLDLALDIGRYHLRARVTDDRRHAAPHAHRGSVCAEPDVHADANARAGSDAPARGSVSVGLRRRIQRSLLDNIDLAQLSASRHDPAALRPSVIAALERICGSLAGELPNGVGTRNLIEELADEAVGLGPLEQLLRDPDVSEIMVVDPYTIYVERRGIIELTPLRFTDDEAVRAAIERIVSPLGRRVDESAPLVDARLPDGSRVNAIIPPLANRGPCITIRRFTASSMTIADLVARGSLSPDMAEFLTRAVRLRKNLVISGGTGSGKTTLLNVLSGAISERERIVTIEDAAELRLCQPHVVSLEARPANLEGKGAYTIRDLVRNALRMRPDRIIVGECRGGEAIDMLQAMNTGHEGSMTTTHANSPSEAVARLEVLCLMSGIELPVRAIRQQIAASVHLIVQQARFADGSRRVTSISEVRPLDEHGEVALRELFRFDRTVERDATGVRGAFTATGHLPDFAGELYAGTRGEP
jgi:pilus assembly protein CpaF